MYVYRKWDSISNTFIVKEFHTLPSVLSLEGKTLFGFNTYTDEKLRDFYFYPVHFITPLLKFRQVLGEKELIWNENSQNFTLTYKVNTLSEKDWTILIDKKASEIAYEANKLYRDYVNSRYSIELCVYYLNLKFMASSVGCEETLNFLQKIEDWKNLVLTYFYEVEAEIFNVAYDVKLGTKKLSDLDSLRETWNFDQFTSMDPNISIPMLESPLLQFVEKLKC